MVTFDALTEKKESIAIVGLGYVGLPLAVQLSAHFKVVGFDLNADRIRELGSNMDSTLEVGPEQLEQAQITYTDDPRHLSECRLIIVAVPTPIDEHHKPDLDPLRSASAIVGTNMVPGTCVVFESTVYPGVTETVCVPVLEKESGLVFLKDFSAGYSPERINPGDRVHTIDNIVKIVSGADEQTTDLLADVYGRIVTAGIHRASSIRVAEAAKVIENTQRDLNIALMNELALIFDRIDIDTMEVLEAAGTKWNFIHFKPGLVGGHCIGVDPYYLTFLAESLGYHPDIILAGRRINDGMGRHIAQQTIKMLMGAKKDLTNAKVAVLGVTFKENVPDLRNTKVVDIIREIQDYGIEVLVNDPLADVEEAEKYYGLKLLDVDRCKGVDAVVLAVIHKPYLEQGLSKIAGLCSRGTPIVVDVKSAFSPSEARELGISYWRL